MDKAEAGLEGGLERVELCLELAQFLLGLGNLIVQGLELGEFLADRARNRGTARTNNPAAGSRADPTGDGKWGNLIFLRSGTLAAASLVGIHFVHEGDEARRQGYSEMELRGRARRAKVATRKSRVWATSV